MIKEFEDIVHNRGFGISPDGKDIHAAMQNIENRLGSFMDDGKIELTAFQKQCILSPKFWQDRSSDGNTKHLVIQGATSAGKTLLSELNILDTLQNGKTAIVLVPLKAMVHERMNQFSKDMPDCRVYGSSGDHLENDERMLDGDFDVAVIVYEKFFAMLSQGSVRFMQKCGLLVVDELSMLSKEQRGPKLEIAIETVRAKYSEIRIMCLATCDCSTKKECEWLDIEDGAIISTARPIPLEEHIVQLNGEGWFRIIEANHENGTDAEPEKQIETIEIPGYKNDLRYFEKRNRLLLAVTRKIYTENKSARLLIFVPSQNDAAKTARYLKENASEIFSPVSLDMQDENYLAFRKAIDSCDCDENQEELIRSLLGNGIAYHHASLSVTLRELIENEFARKNSSLKVIIATETLTVGVNLPFDSMIMLTNKVPRGVGVEQPLSLQEYRNYIGRCGRLGLSSGKGLSYLFVDDGSDQRKYWSSYTTHEEVASALVKAAEKDIAPFYLGLLVGQHNVTFSEKDIRDIYAKSLSCISNSGGRNDFRPDAVVKCLGQSHLIAKQKTSATHVTEFDDEDMYIQHYNIRAFGTDIAPYALSVDTCKDIYEYFIDGYDYGGFPQNVTKQQLESDYYLLDILYHICCHKEIEDSANLNYPMDNTNPERSFEAKAKVVRALNQIFATVNDEGNPMYSLLNPDPDEEEQGVNGLWLLQNSRNLGNEKSILRATMRAIVLFYWTQGKTVREINALTGFSSFTKIASGDIERLAEVVSFHLDAIGKGLEAAKDLLDETASKAFYLLQTRVKYGMQRDLVQLANKHIYGVDRALLLELNQTAAAMNRTPIQYLYFASPGQFKGRMSASHREQLIQALERRGKVSNFSTLLSIVEKDAGTALSPDDKMRIKNIAEWDGTDSLVFFRNLKGLINTLTNNKVIVGTEGNNCILIRRESRTICIGLWENNMSKASRAQISTFFDDYRDSTKILLFSGQENESMSNQDITALMKEFRCMTTFDSVFLAMLLANAFRINLGDCTELFEFMSDARGVYSQYDYEHCTIHNYIHQTESTTTPKFRILCNFSDTNSVLKTLQSELSKDIELKDYEILPWGEALLSEKYCGIDCPIIIILEREQIVRSDSLTKFVYQMENQHFKNCMFLMTSETSKRQWLATYSSEGYGQTPWRTRYYSIPIEVVENGDRAVSVIRNYVGKWNHEPFLIGISYAHYDGTSDDMNGDVKLLRNLAKQLANVYGEHRILFDEFPTANALFDIKGRKNSLDAYRKCKLNLILWNYFAKDRDTCRDELEIITQCHEQDEVPCLFLQCGHSSDPKIPFDDFPDILTDNVDGLIEKIKRILVSA